VAKAWIPAYAGMTILIVFRDYAGTRSTMRGSSTSSSITSLGRGVAVISVTPSAD